MFQCKKVQNKTVELKIIILEDYAKIETKDFNLLINSCKNLSIKRR